MRRELDESERVKIRKLYADGLSAAMLGRRFGRSAAVVHKILHQHGGNHDNGNGNGTKGRTRQGDRRN